EALAREGPGEVIGVDFTEPMLELARRKSADQRRPPGFPTPTYQLADAMDLPFDDGVFDVVTIAFGIRNVADPGRALLEFRRVLRRGGRVVVLEFGRPRGRLARFGSDLYCKRIMPVTATWIAHDRSGAYRYLPRSVATFPDGDAFESLLAAAGFETCRTHPMTLGIAVAYRGIAG
ncbi:MAG: class I SAM-dependent methyltransferase, partial [Phycisphaerales bacterium]|nr:class I SAM-dependent methyltransferase [Phycisphaerales bacterium]